MNNQYFSSHNHTDFSNSSLGFSDSINKTKKLIQYAYDIGLNGIVISDHECLSSFIQAINYYEKMEKTRPFTLGLGNECYLLTEEEYLSNRNGSSNTPYYHFILIALDTIGYHQLCQISTRAWERAWVKSIWRRPTLYKDLEEIIKPNQGHVIGSTACLANRIDQYLLNQQFYEAKAEVNRLIDIFGKGNLYLEIQPSKDTTTEQSAVNKPMFWLGGEMKLPVIPTTDSHYLRKEDRLVHKVFLESQEGEREVDDFYATTYVMSGEELRDYLHHEFTDEQIDVMFSNTQQICKRITKYDIKHNPIIPEIPVDKIPPFKINHTFKEYYKDHPTFAWYSNREEIHERYFFYQIEQGLIPKVVNKNKDIKKYIDRLELEWIELKKISEALNNCMVSYYSTMAELINIMWDVGSFVGAGRGSSAGFLTTYLLDITQLDPVPYGDMLPYWRHVALERGAEIADIDTDSEPCKKYAIIEAVKEFFGEDKVLNVATFGVVSSKTAIERACRGLGINDDVSGYLKSLIPVSRGKIQSLKECLYGENKVTELKNEIAKYENLEKCALGICDVICQRSLHAAGLVISNEPYVNYISAMRAPNGSMCTAFDLWDSESVSLVKFDLLTVDAVQKMHKAMDAMLADGVIEWKGSVRATYNAYLHPDVINYTDPKMWESIPKMYSCFQWNTPISQKALALIKPKNIMDLTAGNSLIRLMPEGRSETPLDTYVRYKENPEAWEKEATEYGLNEEEKQVIREYCADSYYLADCQEKIMRLSQDKRVAGYSLKESNILRKSIARKDPKLQEEAKAQFFEWGKKCGTREIFLDYVWNVLFSASFGYAFSAIHSLIYSLIALQELNIYYFYNPVYWNVGCLCSEASNDDEGSGGTVDYGKVSKAIQKMRNYGVQVLPPNINFSKTDFTAEAHSNSIYYGISAISGINPQIAQQIISNRPYKSFDDFYKKNTFTGSLVTPSKYIQLIKAGCFDEFSTDRVKIMKRFFILSNPKPTQLTMANMANIKSTLHLPKDMFKNYNFYKYVTSKDFLYGNHPKFKSKKLYWLDPKATKYFNTNCISLGQNGVDFWEENDKTIVVDKWLEKIFKKDFDNIKQYINTPEFITQYYKASLRKKFDEMLPIQDANHWSMESVSYYANEHELSNINYNQYNLTSFKDIPVEPVFVEKSNRGRTWKQFELYRICGTVIDRTDSHHLVTILTPENDVVSVKFDGGFYAYLKKQDSEIVDGVKTVLEKSWLNRGNLLMVTGYRRGESDFVIKNYRSSIFNSKVSKINKIYEDGSCDVQTERISNNEE